jgi:hypothetical protein
VFEANSKAPSECTRQTQSRGRPLFSNGAYGAPSFRVQRGTVMPLKGSAACPVRR